METINPYQTPATADTSHSRAPLIGASVKSRVPIVFSLLAVLAYHLFVIVLIRSSSRIDQYAGYLFLANTPFQITWLICAIRNVSRSFMLGFLVSSVQIVISLIMLVMDIGDFEAVVMINGAISTTFGLVSLAMWKWTRRERDHVQDA